MLQEEDFESDTSDEDFVPDGVESDHDDLDSGNDDLEELNADDESQSKKVQKKKRYQKEEKPFTGRFGGTKRNTVGES